ncbi:MAG TPA: hypothetical protein VM120_28875 [Bryobacteraceae bacterium]|nr:hypothetical protein [Bryobacteraceae bacterium]
MSIPIWEVQFDKDANPVFPAQEGEILRQLTSPPANATTDVVVISHGWNNDMEEARTLYREFIRQLEKVTPAGKTISVIGILWPSKKFAETELIPGGAAAAGSDPALDAALLDRLQELKHLFGEQEADEKLDRMKALVADLHKDPGKQNAFVALLGEIMDRHTDERQRSEDEGRAKISERTDGAALLKSFSHPIGAARADVGAGGAARRPGGGLGGNPALGGAGAAAGFGDFLSGIKAGAMRLLNLTTYYAMKDRSGKVGRDGVNPMLSRIQSRLPASIRFHLVGHSFGGRLVTAAVDGPNKLRVQTLLLLQAAYSHNALAKDFDSHGKDGFFHSVLEQSKVAGPILITHSKHDKAVGLAYPLASRLNGDDAAAFGGPDDRFGGMGANGAQHVDRADGVLLKAGAAYDFKTSGKRVFNLNGDALITNHGNVALPETAYVLAAAMSL